jgi:hypothetical protein
MVIFSRKYYFSGLRVTPRARVSKARLLADSHAGLAPGYTRNAAVESMMSWG